VQNNKSLQNRHFANNKIFLFYVYKFYFVQNVQNLLCFLDKSTFFKVTKNVFVKKEEKWAKSTFWAG